jgi:hypothetical protein
MRALLLLHRWLGITCGWFVLLWCLSGFVMMYVAYPEVDATQQRQALAPLDFRHCCRLDRAQRYEPDATLAGARIEMLSGRPVARLQSTWPDLVDLESGTAVEALDAGSLRAAAAWHGTNLGARSPPQYLGHVDVDQWTLLVRQYAPLALFDLGDPAGTRIYLSETGELIQRTTTTQRFWNWLGSVTHWIYPTLLRRHTSAWIQVIIWTSLLGALTTVLGVYIGLRRLKRRRSGRWSPYQGIAWWHHTAGLAFGILALTWLASGFLSVTPWGLLESPGAGTERQQLERAPWTWADFERWVSALPLASLPTDTVRVETAPFAGHMAFVAHTRDGAQLRLDAQFQSAPLALTELRAAAASLHPAGLATADLLTAPDEYYFEHHVARDFPVFRAVLADEEQTRYYFDPGTGALLLKADRPRRWLRWLFEGLHRFDFTAWMRTRPVWDLLIGSLLLGVTAVCFTGTYMGIRYLRR